MERDEQNIFLIGFMGAGKSSVGRRLSGSYGLRLIEMDEEIERREGHSVSQIFSLDGEACFRELETRLIRELENAKRTVISCGGGVPMREENLKSMRKSGVIVYLSARPETVYERVKNVHTRPLLEGHMNVDEIADLMAERLPVYQRAADLTLETDGRSVEELAREIYARVYPGFPGCHS